MNHALAALALTFCISVPFFCNAGPAVPDGPSAQAGRSADVAYNPAQHMKQMLESAGITMQAWEHDPASATLVVRDLVIPFGGESPLHVDTLRVAGFKPEAFARAELFFSGIRAEGIGASIPNEPDKPLNVFLRSMELRNVTVPEGNLFELLSGPDLNQTLARASETLTYDFSLEGVALSVEDCTVSLDSMAVRVDPLDAAGGKLVASSIKGLALPPSLNEKLELGLSAPLVAALLPQGETVSMHGESRMVPAGTAGNVSHAEVGFSGAALGDVSFRMEYFLRSPSIHDFELAMLNAAGDQSQKDIQDGKGNRGSVEPSPSAMEKMLAAMAPIEVRSSSLSFTNRALLSLILGIFADNSKQKAGEALNIFSEIGRGYCAVKPEDGIDRLLHALADAAVPVLDRLASLNCTVVLPTPTSVSKLELPADVRISCKAEPGDSVVDRLPAGMR